MAKRKGLGVVLAGIAVGAVSFLSKKENREKAKVILNDTKSKVESFIEKQKANGVSYEDGEEKRQNIAEAAAGTSSTEIAENHLIDEGGAQTTLNQYNEEQDGSVKQ